MEKWLNLKQVVFEKGVTLECSETGNLFSLSVGNRQSSIRMTIGEFAEKYSIRPLLITVCLTEGMTKKYLLSTNQEKGAIESHLHQLIFDRQAKGILETMMSHSIFSLENSTLSDSLITSLYNVEYITGATIYHCKQLAEIYSYICHKFANLPEVVIKDSNSMGFGNFREPLYEFDALITAARRTYDTTRYILWHVFGPGRGSIPNSFPRTLPHCNNMPSPLATRLEESWDKYGEKLTEYRDCIQHYAPLNLGISSNKMVRIEENLWSTSIFMPDNPEVKSTKKFRFSDEIDALTYGWVLTNEVTEIAIEILRAADNKVNS